MAVGARDFIDKLLVEKYAQEKVDNHDDGALTSKVYEVFAFLFALSSGTSDAGE